MLESHGKNRASEIGPFREGVGRHGKGAGLQNGAVSRAGNDTCLIHLYECS